MCWWVIILLLIPRGSLTVSPGVVHVPLPHHGLTQPRLKAEVMGTFTSSGNHLRVEPQPDHAQFRDDRSLTPADNLSLFSRERLHFRFSEQLTFCSELRSRRDSISHLPRFCFRCERQRERARDPWGGGGEVEVMAQESRRYINHKSACDLIR